MKKCPKCGNNTFLVTAHVAQDWRVDTDGAFLSVVNSCSQTTHQPNDDDLWTCERCGYEAAGSEFNPKNTDKMCYSCYKSISPETDASIWQYLHAYRRDKQQSEDDTICVTAEFPNGIQMDIKCCGAQDDCSWTEAVLFDKHGRQLACSDVEDRFLGKWQLEAPDGTLYEAHIVAEKPNNAHLPRTCIIVEEDEGLSADAVLVFLDDYHVNIGNIIGIIQDAATKFCIDHPDVYTVSRSFNLQHYMNHVDNEHNKRFGFTLYKIHTDVTCPGPDPDINKYMAHSVIHQMLKAPVCFHHLDTACPLVLDSDVPDDVE